MQINLDQSEILPLVKELKGFDFSPRFSLVGIKSKRQSTIQNFQISDSCEEIPLRTPIGMVNRSTKEKIYGILLDCYQHILEVNSPFF